MIKILDGKYVRGFLWYGCVIVIFICMILVKISYMVGFKVKGWEYVEYVMRLWMEEGVKKYYF